MTRAFFLNLHARAVRHKGVRFGEHARITGGALKRWAVAQGQIALACSAIWLAGLLVLHVPAAILWSALALFLHFVPAIGGLLALIGPAIAAALSGGLMRLIYVLLLYAVVMAVSGFVLEPWLMRRAAHVPVWATILVPTVMGIVFNFWGVLLSAPLLAVIYTYRAVHAERPDAPRAPESLPRS